MTVESDQSICQLVAEYPETIPVLEQYGIDYCCSSADTLAEVCGKRDLDTTLALDTLDRHNQDARTLRSQWQSTSLDQIIEFIVKHYHAFARKQLDVIRRLAVTVERRHGGKHPHLFQLSEAVSTISTELEFHLFWEETLLFPYILQLGTGQEPTLLPTCSCGEEPLAHALNNHRHTGTELRLLRELGNDYLPPADASISLRSLYRALDDFENDLHDHIHLENCVLFPRAPEHILASLQPASRCCSCR